MSTERELTGTFERFEDALDEDIRAIGGRKIVACRLRPELKPQDAHTWLNSCLNPDRRHHLDHSYIRLIIKWAKDVGAMAAHTYWCADVEFERGKPLSAREQAESLFERADELARASRAVATQLERLHQSGVLKGLPRTGT